MFQGEQPNTEKKFVDGKEITVVKLKHQPKQTKEHDENDYLYDIATVAYYYPQYTLKQLYEELPAYKIRALIKVARSEQAQNLLLLNAIIHGPNQKNKTNYKKLIKKLEEQAKLL